MIDDELEQRLRAHYRAIDPRPVSTELTQRIDAAIERKSRRPVLAFRSQRVFATLLAAVLIVAVALGLRPGGFLTGPGASPTPTTVPSSPSPSPSSGAPSPSAAATANASVSPVPSSSVPPISSAAWTGIRLQSVDGGPVGVSAVTAWAGGNVALGQPSDTAPLPAWTSPDGRTWTALPSGTFGVAGTALGTPVPGGVIVAVSDVAGQKTTVYRSMDGVTWTSNSGPQLNLALSDSLAGNETGAVAIERDSAGLIFTADGITWQSTPPPGPAGPSPRRRGVRLRFRCGRRQRDHDALTDHMVVGRRITLDTRYCPAHPGDSFTVVYAAEGGLMALSSTGEVAGLTSFWTSADGHTWKLSSANPMGVIQSGEGMGSANGVFSGDGARLIGYDPGATASSRVYWTSLDGTAWTKLAITGDTTVASIFDLPPFLLPRRDPVQPGQPELVRRGGAVGSIERPRRLETAYDGRPRGRPSAVTGSGRDALPGRIGDRGPWSWASRRRGWVQQQLRREVAGQVLRVHQDRLVIWCPLDDRVATSGEPSCGLHADTRSAGGQYGEGHRLVPQAVPANDGDPGAVVRPGGCVLEGRPVGHRERPRLGTVDGRHVHAIGVLPADIACVRVHESGSVGGDLDQAEVDASGRRDDVLTLSAATPLAATSTAYIPGPTALAATKMISAPFGGRYAASATFMPTSILRAPLPSVFATQSSPEAVSGPDV